MDVTGLRTAQCAFTRVSVCVRRRVSHAVADQRLLALDDVTLDPPVVVPPLPEHGRDRGRICYI